MGKRRILFFVVFLGFILFLLPGAFAAEGEVDIFSVEGTVGVPYDGYLVSIRPDARPRMFLRTAGVEEVAEDLYLVDSILSARQTFCEDQIIYIEPNYEIRLFSVPNDPLFAGRQWCMRMISAPLLWDMGITGAGVRVAVIDSGITSDHEDLDPARVVAGWNYIDRNRNVQDVTGHGTRVTGIIAASRDNGLGIAGLTDQVTIVPLKIFRGQNSNLNFAIQAIRDAVDVFQVDVINMSFGTRSDSQALRQAVDHAVGQGVIIVAAAGNDGNTALAYPASLPNVVSVGAVDRTGTMSGFSQRNEALTVTAPGEGVVTLGHVGRSSYYVVDGTSFSAPFVAAMAAAAKEIDPGINAEMFIALLRQSAVHPRSVDFDVMYGYGIICFNRFLAYMPEVVWFNDISGHWAQDNILYMAEQGLVNGIGMGSFAPDGRMNRAMLVTLLGRFYQQMGGDVPAQNDDFIDTERDSWYSSYVAWAAEMEIVEGAGDGRFLPYDHATREMTATVLARFAAYIELYTDGDLTVLQPFVDESQVAPWAGEAMAWMVEQGLIVGIEVPDGMALRPAISTSRAELAVLFLRFKNQMALVPSGVAA